MSHARRITSRDGLKQLVQINCFQFFWRDFSLFCISMITQNNLWFTLLGTPWEANSILLVGNWVSCAFTGDRYPGGPQAVDYTSVRVPAAPYSHLIYVYVVWAILLQMNLGSLSCYLESHRPLPRTSQPYVRLALTKPITVHSALESTAPLNWWDSCKGWKSSQFLSLWRGC